MKISTIRSLYRTKTKSCLSDNLLFRPRVEHLEDRRLLSVSPASAAAISVAHPDDATTPFLTILKYDSAGGSSAGPVDGGVVPGQSLTYTIVVANTGTGGVSGATVADTLPASYSVKSWTATPSDGASVSISSGAGNIDDPDVDLPAGSSVTYQITGTVSATVAVGSTISNTASVTPPATADVSATDTDNVVAPALSSLSGYVYVDANNNGIKDPGEPPIVGVPLVLTGTPTGGGSVNLSQTTGANGSYNFANLAPGNYTITEVQPTNFIDGKDEVGSQTSGTITQTATTNVIGNITLTAGVNGINNNFGNLGETTAYVSKRSFLGLPVTLDPVNSLSITKIDNAGGSSITNTPGNVTTGQSLTYTVVVTNTGTGNATGVTIADPVPSDFTGDTWTATSTGGATGFSASGSGNINATNVSMPAGSTITYVITGKVLATATGTFSNTATVTPPGGTTIPATDTDNLPTLAITKTDNAGGSSITSTTGNISPGQTLVYTITVSNTGPGKVTGASVTDPLPSSLSGASYTTTLNGGATDSNPSGTGVTSISDTVNLPVGSSIVYTVTGTVGQSTAATFSNTATVTAGSTTKTATDTDSLINLSIAKSDNAGGSSTVPTTGNVIPGQTLTYTIVVSNTGPGTATATTIIDSMLSSIFTSDTWTATNTGSSNATGFSTSGSGNIDQTGVTMPAGSTITYTVTGTVSSTATGTLSNSATVTSGSSTKTATDTDNLPNLSITKVDSAGGSSIVPTTGNVTPGQTMTYTIVVSNTGPGNVSGATIADSMLSSIFTSDTWNAASTGSAPATGFAISGTGNIEQTGVDLPADSQITYTVTGTIISGLTGTISNTATVTPPIGTGKTATDTDNLADLTITKVDNAGGSSITPSTGNVSNGQTLVYTITVSNAGPGSVTGASVTDPLPSSLTGASYTATLHGGAMDSNPSGTGVTEISDTVNLPAGSSITYVVTGTLDIPGSNLPVNSITNTATVTPPGGIPKTATDNDNVIHLSITKVDNAGGSSITDTTGNVTPGQSLTYTVVISNTGPGNLTGATITDPIPADVTGDTWTAASTGGVAATGFAISGSGNIDQTGVNMPAGSQITYTITGTVNSAATGSFSNTATVAPPVGTPQTATDTDNLIDLSITKVDNAGGSSITNTTGNALPGQTLTYTVVVGNTGPGTATNATIIDPIPADITGATWTATSTSAPPATGFATSGTGSIDQTGVTLPAGSTITYTITGTVNPAATGTISNTATVTPHVGGSKTATDKDNLPDLTITKTDNAGGSSITPTTGNVSNGQTLIYTITVSNSGPGSVTDATISDPIPSFLSGDTWTATSASAPPATGFATSGSGNINQTGVNLPAGSSITYVVTGTLDIPGSNLPVNSISNTATVTPPLGSSKTATDNDNVIHLSITKVDSAGGSSITDTTGNVTPGQSLTYTVVVSNTGPGNLTGGTITDPIPADVTGDTWTAASTGGVAATGFATSGSGNIDQTGVNMPADSQITYTITGTVNPAATGTFSNTATVAPPAGPPQTATDTDDLIDLSITKVDNAGGSSITDTTGNVLTGQPLTYTVVVGNTGPGTATDATIIDPIPADVTAATWTATSTSAPPATGFATSGTGSIDQAGVTLPAGSTITYTITGMVSPTATGTISNTASVTPLGGTSKTATDKDNLPDLSITKIDNAGGSSITSTTGNVTTGQTLTYTIVVSNAGPGNATNTTISDPIPSELTGDTWTATSTSAPPATGFATSGTGNISQTGVNLPAGSSITYVVTGKLNIPGGDIPVNSISNTATVTSGNSTGTATDSDNVIRLGISKNDSADGANLTPGQSLTYTVVVGNHGTGTATGVTITDPLPANFTSDTWTAANTGVGTATGFATSGSGSIDQTGVTMPPDSVITYTITGTVSSTATGTLSNTATATPPGGIPVTATVSDPVGQPDITIVKSDSFGGSSNPSSVGTVSPGQSLTYDVTVSNTGAGPASDTAFTDTLPGGSTGGSYTTSTTGGATDTTPTGTGNISDTITSLPAGSSITYVITGTVSSTATGTLSNTATATPSTGSPVSATDTDDLTALEITKSDSAGGTSGLQTLTSSPAGTTGNATENDTLNYTITVANGGPGEIVGGTVTDTFPAGYSLTSWSVTAKSAGVTDTTSSGTGSIDDTVTLPSGGSITYTALGFVDTVTTLSNTATATPPNSGTAVSATDTDNVVESTQVVPVNGISAVSSTVAGVSVPLALVASHSAKPNAAAVDAALSGGTESSGSTKTPSTSSSAAVDAALAGMAGFIEPLQFEHHSLHEQFHSAVHRWPG